MRRHGPERGDVPLPDRRHARLSCGLSEPQHGPPPGYFSTTDSCYLTESADLHFICGASVTVLIGYQDVVYSRRPEAAIARARRHIPNVGAQFVLGANDTQTLDRPSSSTTRKPEMPRG